MLRSSREDQAGTRRQALAEEGGAEMITVREERMSDAMVKYHLEGLPRSVVMHRFTEPDHGPFHDHPFHMRSTIVSGGYTEEVLDVETGEVKLKSHYEGETFIIFAHHIHRIVELHDSEVWTMISPYTHQRKSGFYEWRDGKPYHRFWDEPDFQPYDPARI
jgi:hypothetical protein